MDPQLMMDLAKGGFLLAAVIILWRTIREDQAKREKQMADAEARCTERTEGMVKRLESMEDQRHAEAREDKVSLMSVVERNSRAFEKWADAVNVKTESGPHPTKEH